MVVWRRARFGNENSVLCETGDETRMTWDYIVKFNANASDHVRYDKDKEPYSFLKTIDGKRSIPYAAHC